MAGLKHNEERILNFLIIHQVSFPVNHIAKKIDLSWATVNFYLEIMTEEGYTVEETRFGKKMYKINAEWEAGDLVISKKKKKLHPIQQIH